MFDELVEVTAPCIFYNEFEVCAPITETGGRRKRSVNALNSTLVEVAVSNDGSTFGETSTVVVMDTTCHEITNATGTPMSTVKVTYNNTRFQPSSDTHGWFTCNIT